MAEGRLPNLAALRDRGGLVPCHSTRPPVTFPAWTTCVTGVNPGKHGIFDFTEVVPGQQRIQFLNSSFRRAPALWNILSDAGKRCCVLGVPGTYPPEPINGVMVAGFDSPVATAVDATFVHPADRFDQVKDWRFADFQESNIGPGWHGEALKRLLAKIDDKERIACDLLREEPWDFFMVVFGESDTVSHHFWLFHDPVSPRHRPGHETAIRKVYERLDAAVGKLVKAAGEDAVIGIVSDHGFGGAGTGVVHLNNWLAQQGYLTFGAGGDSLLKRIALKTVPARMRGALFRRFKHLATGAESKSRFSGIDWADTTAWSEELNYFPNIRHNLKGRDPEGTVNPEDYDRTVAELCAKLNAWEHVAHAWPRAELFTGPEVDRAPDIIVELALENGYSHSCLRSRGGEAFRRIREDEYLGGKEKGMTGNHRDPGVLMLSAPFDTANASLQDVAPTVLATLNVPGPEMDGRPLLGTARETTAAAATRPERQAYTAEEEALIESRLRNLGYFE
jgi:predicted AlkP superfamily phosphohydrolase/phosphomutase